MQWEINADALEQIRTGDDVFPLVRIVRDYRPLETLQAYERRPVIEKRISQLMTDFAVAPVYLNNVSRIQAILVQTMLERELRGAMQAAQIESLPRYPEGRACECPTARHVLDVFDSIQQHTLTSGRRIQKYATVLTQIQRRILKLL